MFKERVRIIENKSISRTFLLLSFESRRMAAHARPGHFIQMRVSDSFDPFLPRPMSIARVEKDRVDILYIVAGRGTALMRAWPPGTAVEVWGPLGTAFSMVEDKPLICVSGGVGVAPMIFLAQKQNIDHFLFGVRTNADLPALEAFGIQENSVQISSNDGSIGTRGYVTTVFDELINRPEARDAFVYTCGPNPMMALVVRSAKGKNLAGEASLEEQMACGVGACLGCVADTHRGRLTVCREGPVLPFKDLLW